VKTSGKPLSPVDRQTGEITGPPTRARVVPGCQVARLYLLVAAWIVGLFTLLWLVSGCSPNYEALGDMVGMGEKHGPLTDYDRELTERARLDWCEKTDGACCPERIEVLIGERAGYDRKRLRIWINEEVVSADDWYMASLYAIGFVCGVPASDDPRDAMCGLSISMGLSEHDIAVAKRKAGAK